MTEEQDVNRGRWFGKEFCPHNGESPIDGCYFCGRRVSFGDHNHTQIAKDKYSCVCDQC